MRKYIRIPLNDDKQEKAVRLQSRHALHDLQMNQLKAAATPMRKLNGYDRAASSSPKTPQSHVSRGKDKNEDGGLAIVGGNATTPMKRVPILANFEEWMKMATDNKINATNSWNFALIDYFHDMSLLKEGDGVNFQKASCTLDGCVKIYTSRVDSVATETGKLLSGLADSGNKRAKQGGVEEEEGDEREDGGEDGMKKRAKRKAQRSSEATMVPVFASLQLRKFELEFSVDPLFKKASADFDEGGAKGLLLNHLAIDSSGRIVFDSSDDAEDATGEAYPARRESGVTVSDDNANIPASAAERSEIDIETLGLKFFSDLARLDGQDICPSLKNFDLGDPTGSMDIPLLKAPEDWKQARGSALSDGLREKSGIFLDDDNAAGFDDDDGDLAGLGVSVDADFGEGGEAWAKDVAIDAQTGIHNQRFDIGEDFSDKAGEGMGVGDFSPDGHQHVVSLHHDQAEAGHQNILSYFDNALRKNWAGPEHWRIRRMKDITKAAGSAPTKRREKEPFEVNFLSPLDALLAESIYTPAISNTAISLPKSLWKSKTRNLLPDDKHFNSRQLLRLFLKPRACMSSRRSGFGNAHSRNLTAQEKITEGEIDEAFWARKGTSVTKSPAEQEDPRGNYDADFFQDDGMACPSGPPDDDDEFADAREQFSSKVEDDPAVGSQDIGTMIANTEGSQQGAFGTQLVTQNRRLRPEYMQYARVAKKVDVRRLKEEMWRGIGFEKAAPQEHESLLSEPPHNEVLRFTTVMNNLQQVYPKQAMADISTSYCFICLLHLANEKGLTLGSDIGLEELSIRKDLTAEITEGVE
ncbi:hypothetical protein MMC07_003295 [Pseudocyphellaria aurata]|nr:hypothetical protein [Pseudocyphellaria aurata]